MLWGADDGEGDYEYPFGQGIIDPTSNRFSITLPERPPEAALSRAGDYRLGVGTILVLAPGTTVQEWRVELGDLPTSAIIGAAGRYAIIYTAGDRDDAPAGWWRSFPRGYAAGRGVTREDTFDEFERVDPNVVEITIDDAENIEFVNWT